MLKALTRTYDDKSLFCSGKIKLYSHIIKTPLRVLGIPLENIRLLVELYDYHSDILKRYNVITPIIELDLDVRMNILNNVEKTFKRYADYIEEIKRKFNCYSIVIPIFSSEVSKKIVHEIKTSKIPYTLSIFLSHYVDQDYIDLLCLPILKIKIYDRAKKERILLVNADLYIRYIQFSIDYFQKYINKPFFIPLPKIRDVDLRKLLEYFIDHNCTNILLDYDGSSFKKLTDLIRLLRIEYGRSNLLDNLIIYGTRIIREVVSQRMSDEVKFADILALIGLDILGSNYKKRFFAEEEHPILGSAEYVERYFNNQTYGYRHEKYLGELDIDLLHLVQELSINHHGLKLKRVLFRLVNTKRHREETEKYSEILSRELEIIDYLKSKRYVSSIDIKCIKSKAIKYTLEDFL